MGKRNLLLASSLVISILAVLIGSSFATAATIGGGALPEGCKKATAQTRYSTQTWAKNASIDDFTKMVLPYGKCPELKRVE